jgi:hypothetical protein
MILAFLGFTSVASAWEVSARKCDFTAGEQALAKHLYRANKKLFDGELAAPRYVHIVFCENSTPPLSTYPWEDDAQVKLFLTRPAWKKVVKAAGKHRDPGRIMSAIYELMPEAKTTGNNGPKSDEKIPPPPLF